MPLLNIWNVQATQPSALSGLIFIISVVYVAQQYESSTRGLSVARQVLSQFLLILLTAMVTCAGTVSLTMAVVVSLYAVGGSGVGGTAEGHYMVATCCNDNNGW